MDKAENIMGFRDISYRSLMTWNMQPFHHTPWVEAMDDSIESYLQTESSPSEPSEKKSESTAYAQTLGRLNKKGLGGAVRAVFRHGLFWSIGTLYRNMLKYIALRREFRFDKKHNVDTSGLVMQPETSRPNKHLGHQFASTPPKSFRRVLTRLNIDFSDYTFIDYGSGKGRTLLLASNFSFKKIIGVEYGNDLNEVAIRNLDTFQSSQ